MEQLEISSENLAYWFLRLNGFLTITNFIVHPDSGNRQETDVDILGVRFPFRSENLYRPMIDFEYFRGFTNKPLIVISEVKTGLCNLNGPWTNPGRMNMNRVLHALGAFCQNETEAVASNLYSKGFYENERYHITLLCIGKSKNDFLISDKPEVPQILWNEILSFIYERFKNYSNEKVSHPQWDEDGKKLWECAMRYHDITGFIKAIDIIPPI